ncbi:Nucleoporin Ndc1 [Trachymyrmex zeteki]|uniref:Nucleoporin Ndc1 n=1 Tax=Mycetomoellerius zeteki TaxID=64791 RepID=A0A151X8H5_9HYME|nr:Nucleoporin Ndc1 [Trachymyrmex zeteki]
MIETDKKGCRELLMQRMTLAIITSVMLQLFIVCCVILLTNLSTDYAHWLEETWTIVMSPRMWAYIIVLTMVTFLQSFFCSKNYLHPPPYYKSRFAKLCMTLGIQSLLQRTLYTVIGGILVWLQLSLKKGNYSSSTTDCSIVYGTAYTPDSSETTLIDVLSMDKIPIMQHLGYLDLVILAQKEKMRRNMLFTLSQPGGHPYNWNCVVQKSTNLLEKFSLDLNAISTKSQDQSCYSTLTARVPPVQQSKYIHHMRKLVPDTAPVLVSEEAAREAPYSGSFIHKFIKQKKDAFVAYLLSKPLINYIFGEQDDNKIRYALQNGQLVIWAAEAISSLTVFSLSEDSYGIVQKDVPIIINTLLSVKQALDKLPKSAVLARKMQADDKLIREIFTSLRSAIKRSLYRIVTNFEPYINDLSLELPIIEQLQAFLNYKE